jgi:prophage regulatory protein
MEVKMPGALNRKPIISAQLLEKNSGQPVLPEQLIHKKMPQSQKSSDANLNGTSDTLDDVSFLRLPEVKAVTGLSKTSIYELIREKSFPPPVRLGPRAVAWVKSEIRQWAVERVQASRSAA